MKLLSSYSLWIYTIILMQIARLLQLEDGHTLFDYSVGLNDLVQLMVRAAEPIQVPSNEGDKKVNGYVSSDEESSKSDKENQRVCTLPFSSICMYWYMYIKI